jgi:hypothetical protein
MLVADFYYRVDYRAQFRQGFIAGHSRERLKLFRKFASVIDNVES